MTDAAMTDATATDGTAAAPADAPLTVSGLYAGYGAGDILKGIDLAVPRGGVFTAVGPNGSGKSTLIKTLAGLVRPRLGSIQLSGADVTRLNAPRRVSRGLAYVPQEHNVFRNLTVGENLKVSAEFLARDRRANTEQRARILEMFPDIANRLSLLAGNLSGGQRQMLAFACALLANPEVLLLDEPSAGLSPKFVEDIFQAVRAVNESGVTVFLIEQNVVAAMPHSDTAMVLVAGKVRLTVPAAELLTQHDLHALYLGEAE